MRLETIMPHLMFTVLKFLSKFKSHASEFSRHFIAQISGRLFINICIRIQIITECIRSHINQRTNDKVKCFPITRRWQARNLSSLSHFHPRSRMGDTFTRTLGQAFIVAAIHRMRCIYRANNRSV
jgi:hypothetical protein